jgi:hypothetical protein
MNSEIIIIIGGLVTNIVTGFSSWFFTRRKYNGEVKANEILEFKDLDIKNVQKINFAAGSKRILDEGEVYFLNPIVR